MLQPYAVFDFAVPCALCRTGKKPGTPMACLPDDDFRYDTSDPWACQECIESGDEFEVAKTDCEWQRSML